MVSSLRYFLCLIAVIPSLTVAAEASWDSWQSGGRDWRGGVATTPYCGCYGYGYPYYTAAVIRLTGGYGYLTNYSYDYGYPNAYCPYVRRPLYAAGGVRRVRAYRSVATVSSSAATRVPSSPSKTVQTAPAGSASPKSPWTPMTIPVPPSPANEPPKTATGEAGRAASEWARKFELKLNQLSPDMLAASALLEQEGFRVDSGNKSFTGWFLTAHDDSNQRRGSIKLQSDETKIVLTVTGQQHY